MGSGVCMSTTDALPARPVQWSVGEVAEYLGVQRSTVRAYVARGEMPEPDGRVWRTPWWWDGTIIAWQQARPGRARTWRGLNAAARAELTAAGISVADWIAASGGSGTWHGDACGCTDDRCIGYHHRGHISPLALP